MDTKTCSACRITKPLTDFYPRRGQCKPCVIQKATDCKNRSPEARAAYLAYQKSYQAGYGQQHRINRFAWLDQLKAQPCKDCERTFPPECMDFDHRDPKMKLFNVSQAAVSGRSLESVRAEVEKCDLVCACCHRIRTAKQQSRRPRR